MINKKDYIYSIAVVICWYGKLPWYFRFFVQSVRYNSSIDFIIITDEYIEIDLPSNIKVVKKSLDEIRQIATMKLGFQVALTDAYKLCDFKPAYGLLFEDYLQGYDFWGHGDCDIIFGQIRNFLTFDILEHNDVIALRHDFLTGYFTLFRNNNKLNNLFKCSKDYKKVFTAEKHFCFDETNFCFKQFTDGLHYLEVFSEIESMTHVVKKMQEIKYINAYFDFLVIEGAKGKIKWNNGILTYNNKIEAILYHLIKFKAQYKNIPDSSSPIPAKYRITETDIIYNN